MGVMNYVSVSKGIELGYSEKIQFRNYIIMVLIFVVFILAGQIIVMANDEYIRDYRTNLYEVHGVQNFTELLQSYLISEDRRLELEIKKQEIKNQEILNYQKKSR